MPNSPPLLTEIASRHSVYIERLKTSEFNKFEKFLRMMDEALKKRLAGKDLTSYSTNRIEKLIKSVRVDLSLINRKYLDKLNRDFAELAAYESEFETRALNQVVKHEFILPTETQLKAAVFTNPLSVEGADKGKLLTPYLKDHTDKQVGQVANAIRTGFYQGQTTNQMLQAVRGTRKNKFTDGILYTANKTAEMIVKTSVQHVANQARQETWRQNDDIITGYRITVTFDSRTSEICRDEGERREIYKIGGGPVPPLHNFCLTGDTNISTSSDILNIYKRTYKGAMINIVTKSGRVVKITPNHPILTGGGWKSAKEINISDKVVCINDKAIGSDNKNTVKSKFSDLFSALNIPINSCFFRKTPTTAKDFHGDVTDSEVQIINTSSFGNSKIKTALDKNVSNSSFIGRSSVNFPFLRFSPFNFFFNRSNSTGASLVTCANLTGSFFRRHNRPLNKFLLTLISNINIMIFKQFNYSTGRDAELVSNTSSANPTNIKVGNFFNSTFRKDKSISISNSNVFKFENIRNTLNTNADNLSNLVNSDKIDGIEFDNVVDVSLFDFDGHVYNLENKVNWYTSNDIITHNCRSSTEAVLDDRFSILDKGATKFSRGDDGIEKVDTDLGYYGWLKTQSKEFQLSTGLGAKRVELLRNGGLTSKRFSELQLHKNFEPMTLKEMRELEPLAFEKANI